VAATDIPLLRRKIAAVRQEIGFLPRSHRDKTLLNVLETYPRDELIEIAHADLVRIARGIVALHEREQVRVFMRDDAWGRYVSAIVYMPRDRFDTTSASGSRRCSTKRWQPSGWTICHARRVAAGAPAFHRPYAGWHAYATMPLRSKGRWRASSAAGATN
jgi:hypothetical protein